MRAGDAAASSLRWKDRDVGGKALFSAGATLEVVDDLIFSPALRDPFGLVLEALSKPTANALFVMPEAVAKTPASAQISSAVGSPPDHGRAEECVRTRETTVPVFWEVAKEG